MLILLPTLVLGSPEQEKAVERVQEKLKRIVYVKSNGKKSPEKTLLSQSGNCLESAKLAVYLLKQEGIKAKIRIEPTHKPRIKHAVVIYKIGIRTYRISNGKTTQTW